MDLSEILIFLPLQSFAPPADNCIHFSSDSLWLETKGHTLQTWFLKKKNTDV